MNKPTGNPNGRPPGEELRYALELGITKRSLRRLGGSEALRRMTPEARAVIIKPWFVAGGQERRKGGIKACGMLPQIPGRVTQPHLKPIEDSGFLIQPHVPGVPLDMILGEDDVV